MLIHSNKSGPKKRPPQYSSCDQQTGMLESDFLTQVREKFIGSGAEPNWPGATEPDPIAKAALELPDVLGAMFLLVEGRTTSLLGGAPGTALAILNDAATAAQWPSDNSAVPAEWKDSKQIFRRYEVACAINIMLEAYSSTGGGGGPRDWPPEHP